MSTSLPEQHVDFDLDAEERPADQVVAPFVANVGGRAIVMTDPAEIDWQDLLEIESPAQFLRHCVSREDRLFIQNEKMPGWKFSRLIERYQEHYGLDTKTGRR